MFPFRPNQFNQRMLYPPQQMHVPPPFPYQNPQQQTAGIGSQLLSKINAGNINLESILNNIQKVLGVAERVTPMIEQYGPLIKSAPALLELLKDSNEDSSEAGGESNEQTDGSTEPAKLGDGERHEDEHSRNDDESENPPIRKKQPRKPKESVPKLYI